MAAKLNRNIERNLEHSNYNYCPLRYLDLRSLYIYHEKDLLIGLKICVDTEQALVYVSGGLFWCMD